jgi:hypothetical protein
MRVSKPWNDFIWSRGSFWKQLNFITQNKAKPLRYSFVRKCVDRVGVNVEEVSFNRVNNWDVLRLIATRCKRLKSIEIYTGAPKIEESLIDAVMYAKNLRKIRLPGDQDFTFDLLGGILKRRPELEELECHSLVDPSFHQGWNLRLPNLRKLDLRFAKFIDDFGIVSANLALLSGTNLCSLQLLQRRYQMSRNLC